MFKVNLKRYTTTLIALFLGLFLSKAQSADSLAFKLKQDSTDINAFVSAAVNENLFWKQQVLSNVGGAVQNLSLEIPTLFSDFKISAYDPYIALRKPFDYSHYYKFTQLEYKTTINDGQYISAMHTQVFEKFSFGIFYQKLLSQGDFYAERKDHVNTEFRISYHPEDKKYHTSFSLLHNVSEVRENGGFQFDSIYTDQGIISDDGIPTQLNGANNTLKNTEFNWHNKYTFTFFDSLKVGFIAKSSFRKESEVYTDKEPMYIGDTEPYYPNFYIDSTATSDSIGFTSLSQEFLLSTRYKNFELKPYLKIASLNYNLGFNQQSTTAVKLGLYAEGFNKKLKANFAFKNRTDLSNTKGIEFTTTVNPIKPLSIQFYYNEQAPDLFYQRYESNHFRWNNDFSREKHLRINADLKLLKQTTIRAFYHKIQDYIYLNEEAIASQSSLEQSARGLELNSILKPGKFIFSSQLLVQQTTGEVIQLPDFVGRIKLAYQNKMLGEALVQPGIQLNYSTAYYAPRYMTALSNFYYQNTHKIGGAFLLDLFVNVRVSNFTFYGVVSNLLQTQMLDKNFVSEHYVGPTQQFNFGIRWNFYDK